MATDLEKLVVQLSADIKGYEREMRKAVGVTNRQAREIENRFRAMNRNLDGIGRGAARSLIAPFTGVAAALGGRELIRMTSAWTDLTSRVNIAAGSLDKGAVVMERVSEMARRTYSDLTLTAEGYLAFSTTLTELGVSTDRQLDFVESLNNALVISGAKGQTAERVMGALSKAMALGSLQGDNLNTIIESGGRVAQALAESMGVTTMELRELGSEGKIGRRELLGITSQMGKLRREAGEMPTTIQDGFMLLNNALLEYVGRGDDAVGISGRIAEAMAVIADNFDTVADAGLKLAAVLGAAMLGRSIGGLVANLGAATGVLIRFGGALKAAGSMASVGTAMGGLSAAAGPLGMLFAGLLAGGFVLYSERAREAEQRSNDLRTELEAMGLYAPDAADALSEVADAVDGIGTENQINRIRKLKDGLEALTGSGGWREALLWDFSELGKALDQVGFALSSGRGIDKGDRAALQAARDLFAEYKNGEATLAQVRDRLADISRVDMSKRGRQLLSTLDDIANAGSAATSALAAMGEISGLDSAIAQVSDLRDRIDQLAHMTGVGDAVVAEIDRIVEASDNGSMSATAAADAIEELGNTYPGFSDLFAKITAAIGRLGDLRAAARQTAAAVAAADAAGSGSDDSSLDRQNSATEAYTDELRRQNALSRERQDIEKRTERIMQDGAKAGAALTREQAEQLAIEQAAADARRTAEGRSTGGGSGRKSAGGGRSKKSEPGLFDEIAGDLLQLEREITLVGKSTAEVAKARAQWAMLDEAKKRGLTVNDALTAQIDAQAASFGNLTYELEQAEIAQQQFDNAIDGIADAFAGALVAGESLRKGMAQVLKQIASDIIKSGIRNAISGMFSGAGGGAGAGIGRFLGRVLGFEHGGPTPAGPRKQAVGIVHAGENVWSQDDIRRAGGMAVVEALRRSGGRLQGYEAGGPVLSSPQRPTIPRIHTGSAGQRRGAVDLRVGFDHNGNLEMVIDERAAKVAGVMVVQAGQAQKRAVPGQIRDIQARGTR